MIILLIGLTTELTQEMVTVRETQRVYNVETSEMI